MKIIGFIIALFVCVGIFDHFKEKPILEYCEKIVIGTSSKKAIETAKSMNLITPLNVTEEAEKMIILNQRAPYFRYACELTFNEMKIVSKRTFTAD